MHRTKWIAALVLTALWGGSSVLADEIDDVQKTIWDKYKAIKSLRSKMKMVSDIDMQGFKSHTEMHGTWEMVRKDDKYLMRTDSETKSESEMNGEKTKSSGTSLLVVDEEYTWSYSNTDGNKYATKSKNQAPVDVNPFEMWRNTHDLSLLPEDQFDGNACYVIQAVPKSGSDMPNQGKAVMWYRKDNGVAVKMVSYTADGKPMSTAEYTDVEVNKTIDPDRFVFKAPEGVEVVDMSQSYQAQPQEEPQAEEDAQPAEEKPAEEKPADEEKPKEEKKKGKLPKLPDFP